MTAIIAACQKRHKQSHLVTDAAIYQNGSGVVAFGTKVSTVSHWPGALTTAGSAAASALFARELSQQFSTWDDMVENGERDLPELGKIVADYGLSHATVVLVGYSAKRGPESYTFQTTLTLPPGTTAEEAAASPYYQPPFALVKLPDVIMTPVCPPEMSIAAKYEGIDVEADPDVVAWSMHKVIEMQRHMPLPYGVGGIGGFAEIATVSERGVTTRVLHRWPEDKIGGPLRPKPTNWSRWHIENPKPKRGPALQVVK